MRKVSFVLAGMLALGLIAGQAISGGALKSGPQVGAKVPGPFHPLNVTGANAGQKHCLYCECGPAPVAMIFAREVSPGLTKLIKQIDAVTGKNSKAAMGSFVVFLSSTEALPAQLKTIAEKEGLKHTVLSVDNPAGPERYSVSKDADVTVVLYEDFTVRANHSFRRGELNEKAVDRVVADLSKIVPTK